MEWHGLLPPMIEGFTGFVPPSGTGSSGVCVMAEAPGEQEARHGVPLYPKAPAGSVFDRLLRRAGYERDQFILTNAVWSRPPNNYLEGSKVEGEAIQAFAPHRDKLFEVYRPRVFLLMGNVALKTMTPYGGRKATVTALQGYVLDGPYDGTWCIPCIHPAAILRGEQRMSGVVIWALQRAMDIARNGFCRLPTNYVTHPSLEDMLAFERGYSPDHHFLSYDIETPESSNLDEEEVEDRDEDITYQINRASLCYDAPNAHAISFPWQPPYIDIARRMLGSLGPKRVWNGNFDNPRLRAAGAPVAGRIHDSMWAWKFLQPTLPRSLGFVAPFYNWTGEPWKHTSDAEPERYSCQDAHALQQIGDGVDAHLRQKGQWDIYERHVVHLGEVLDRMSSNGLPYSKEKATAFEAELQAKWDERFNELQVIIPNELKPSKQKGGYKKPPLDTGDLESRLFSILGSDLTAGEVAELGLRGILPQPFEIYVVRRLCKLEPFLPTSWQQLLGLIKHYGQKAGTNRKTKKETTEDDTLRKLVKKCTASRKPREQEFARILEMCRECRQLQKVLGTYIKGWKPGPDGRIHATPGHWGKMFRVSWRRPNISATIQDKTENYIASGFRKCVATTSGRLLLECDWKGIEAVLVGWFAADPDYQRLARLGVHDYMGIHMAGGSVDLALPDSSLLRLFKDFKKAEPKIRDDAKHTVHGTNYGMGPRLMADLYGMTEARAKQLQAMYFELFPKVRAWQKSVLDRASRECRLRNPFGYEMPFWEVFRWDSKYQRWALGEDAKSAIAFLPRDTAAAMLKEVLLRLKWLADDGILLCSTHDSLTCEVPEDRLIEIATIVKGEMERPVPELNNLSIGVECKAGGAWHESSMEIIDLEVPSGLVPA